MHRSKEERCTVTTGQKYFVTRKLGSVSNIINNIEGLQLRRNSDQGRTARIKPDLR